MAAKTSNRFREELAPMIAEAHYQALYQGALIALKINPSVSDIRSLAALTGSPQEALETILLAANWPDRLTMVEGMMNYLRQTHSK